MTTSQLKSCVFYHSLNVFSDLLLKPGGTKAHTRTAKPIDFPKKPAHSPPSCKQASALRLLKTLSEYIHILCGLSKEFHTKLWVAREMGITTDS